MDLQSFYSIVLVQLLGFSSNRLHHEIYLLDARKVEPAKLKTVIRHPIKKAGR